MTGYDRTDQGRTRATNPAGRLMTGIAAYLAATEPKPRGPSPESRALANRRRTAANLAAVEPTPKPKPREPLSRCIDCGGLIYRRRPCTSPFCA